MSDSMFFEEMDLHTIDHRALD